MKSLILFLLCFFMALNSAIAIDVAPRISDREIIESLMRLEAGIEANRQAIEVLRQAIEVIRQDIGVIRQAIEVSRTEMLGFMKWGFGLLLTGMFILFGFILWDRQNTLKPIINKIDKLEKKKVNRTIAALKKASENDVNIAGAMRTTALL